MKQLIKLKVKFSFAVLLITTMACKKDLPELPPIGNQGTFCWEQFQNNSFDPVSEWVDSDPSDFPPCNLPTVNIHQANTHRHNVQFTKNNPNVIYYVKKYCSGTSPCPENEKNVHLVKYNFCTHKEEVINASLVNGSNFSESYLKTYSVGNEEEVFFASDYFATFENLLEYEYYYSNDDMNTFILDTGLQRVQHFFELKSMIPGQGKLIYNRAHQSQSDYKLLVCDVTQNTYDTLYNLSGYYIHEWVANNKWVVRTKGHSPDFYEYQPSTEVLTPISELQNVDIFGYEHADVAMSDNRAVIMNYEHITDSDYGIGNNTILFNANDYNSLILKGVSMSPNGNYLVAVVDHIKWVSNCDQEVRNYLLVFNLQTGAWKAIDFDN